MAQTPSATGKAELQRWLARPALYPRYHELMFLPSRSLHASWYAQVFPEMVATWLQSGVELGLASHRWLSSYLIEQTARPGPEHPVDPLTLLPADRLQRWVARLGVLLVGRHIRQALSRADIEAHRNALGKELYEFTMGPALLLRDSDVPLRLIAAEDTRQMVDLAGINFFRWMLAEPDWLRIRLCFPKPLVDAAEALGEDSLPLGDDAVRLAWRLLRETDTQWYSLLAPMRA
ncbi:SctK family type III secretion system sorting platform protein [Parachitinimonas caeni]|uniref:SctK family type III secretion system sorting platform protein n=1 Tax=Parachitinimonas caeni TaxID=3031301 RepID=A0ABT7DTV3_9NEIS|nr:SctK family type III secretion system sorting platform protein [Parachitinimonas caeni]MDK2123495.1 SctK family type III secretion system sorting platform protein [Parachitinimonas caeni]